MTFHSNCTPLPFIKFSLSDHIIIIFEPTLNCWSLYFTIIFLFIYQIHQSLTKISSGLTSINIPSISLFFLHVRLSYFMTVFYFFIFIFWPYLMAVKEKAMAPHSSTLAWKIPWTEEPGGLQSMGSLRVGHNWVTSFSLFTFMHWRRKWQPTPVFLPEESRGWGSLVGCHLWGRTEWDTTEVT